MTNLVPIVPGGFGNTIQIPPSRHWCFTLNNYTPNDIVDFVNYGSSNSSIKFVFQEETGEHGTPHLQGYIDFGVKLRPKKLFNDKIHWEKCRNIKKSIEYCQKENTRTGQVFYCGLKRPKTLKLITKLRQWQKHILDICLAEPDDRTIYWFYEKIGGVGKSAFVKLLCAKHGALLCSGKASDIKYLIVKYNEKHNAYPEIILYDIPRSSLDYVSYTGIEEVKNGCFTSSKYECEMVIMNSPHIICFANEEPDYNTMSKDRWKVAEIKAI